MTYGCFNTFTHSFLVSDDARWDSDMEFYKALGSKEPIKSADDGGDDAQFERVSQANVALFRCTRRIVLT